MDAGPVLSVNTPEYVHDNRGHRDRTSVLPPVRGVCVCVIVVREVGATAALLCGARLAAHLCCGGLCGLAMYDDCEFVVVSVVGPWHYCW